jgi:hypothetical protein
MELQRCNLEQAARYVGCSATDLVEELIKRQITVLIDTSALDDLRARIQRLPNEAFWA